MVILCLGWSVNEIPTRPALVKDPELRLHVSKKQSRENSGSEVIDRRIILQKF
jgi:hypothetical protein